MKFFIRVYGCQMNVYDAEKIQTLLLCNGHECVNSEDDADIVIFYTCNVREKAKSKLLSDIGRINNRKDKIIAIGGCIAQAEGNALFDHDDSIKIVFGPQTYHEIISFINRACNGERVLCLEFLQSKKFNFLPMHSSVKKSEYVTIQEGCNNFCTYCVVPYTRGREYSRPVREVLTEIQKLVDKGAVEIVLVGQNVNSYNGDTDDGKKLNIGQLIELVANIKGIKRLRYLTSNPYDFNRDLMFLHKELQPLLPPFIHIPIQSGSDRILKRMNRGHTRSEYIEMIEEFRDICTNINFSSDFIVGFPGGSEEDFLDTLDIVEKIRYSSFFAFKYSRRKNTPAYSMTDQVLDEVKDNRLARLINALSKHQLKFNESCVGTVQKVLFEKCGKQKSQYIGKTQYMQSVIVKSDKNLIGNFVDVRIERGFQNSLFGSIV